MRTGTATALAFAVFLIGCTSSTQPGDAASSTAPTTISQTAEASPEVKIGDVCGGVTGAVCEGAGESTYCKKPKGQCSDLSGVCAPIGDPGCPEVYDPVCGCDGVTYSNACNAEASGANIASNGECATSSEQAAAQSIVLRADTGEPCHGKAGILCANDGDFCKFPDGTCNNPDMLGVCTKSGSICTTDYVPVCECDGNTYSNECVASQQGVSVLSQGECGDLSE